MAAGGSVNSLSASSTRIQSQREEIRKLLHDFIRASVDIKTRLQSRLGDWCAAYRLAERLHSHKHPPHSAKTDGNSQQKLTRPDWLKVAVSVSLLL